MATQLLFSHKGSKQDGLLDFDTTTLIRATVNITSSLLARLVFRSVTFIFIFSFLEYMSICGREDRLAFRLPYSPMEDHCLGAETKRKRGPALTWLAHELSNTQLHGSDGGQASAEFSTSNYFGWFKCKNNDWWVLTGLLLLAEILKDFRNLWSNAGQFFV